MISIIIPTLNREEKIIQCLKSLSANKKAEIIVLDQNNNTSYKLKQYLHKQTTIKYIKTNTKNKSKALNKAISASKGDIIAFTDDDCIVSQNWVKEIRSSFTTHLDISCITGNTYPFGSIELSACPPTIARKNALFTKPQYHTVIGYGNNFAIRKSVFTSVGIFKTWLGPGSIGSNCEDGEIILRLLTHKRKILHNEDMIVYHNKNLDSEAYKNQQYSYVCGEMACYTYYALRGWKFAQQVIKKNTVNSFMDLKRITGNTIKRKTVKMNDWIYTITLLFMRLKGLSVGTFYYGIDHLRNFFVPTISDR